MSKASSSVLGAVRRLCSFGLVAAALIVPASCGRSAATGTDSNTHWLERCDSGTDCGALACLCGQCTQVCSEDAGCAGLPDATCVTKADCGSEPTSVCAASSGTGGGGTGGGGTGGGGTGGGGTGGGGTGGGGTGGGGTGGGGGLCAAMVVGDDGAPCTGVPRYYWDGVSCARFACETCVGADCERLYASAFDCDQAHAECYADAGVSRACTEDDECTLAIRGCCGRCGQLGSDELVGIRLDSRDAFYSTLCDDRACPDCVSSIDPSAHAVCSEGFCAVESACACGDTTERCAERLAATCAGALHCPPTLDDNLDYANWSHDAPRGLESAHYSTCDDGTSYFTRVDPFGESGWFLAFDPTGKLYFSGNALTVTCGEYSQFDSGSNCRACDILREGGLEPVDTGSGGEGGAATNPVGTPYCLLDPNGLLVMPGG